jgi:GDPmannose 4,6-dehydratase
MSKVALITGANAMDSKTLARFLQWKDYRIVLTYRRNSLFNQDNWFQEVQIDAKNLHKISFEVCDITDQSSVRACLENVSKRFGSINELYLIAAMSHVGMSFTQREYSILANGQSCYFFLEWLKNYSKSTRVYFANTSEVAGNVPDQTFFNEKTTWNPKSPYSLGKQLGGGWIKLYRESLDSQLFTCFGILFNHSNYFRTKDFYIAKVCNAAASIALGQSNSLALGNLNFYRDEHFSDFGVEMMYEMLQLEEPEDFVIGTGKTWHGEQYLDAAFNYFNLDWKKYVKIDNVLKRPNEVYRLISDSCKAKEKLGWDAERMSFDQHIGELCSYWHTKLSGKEFIIPNIHQKYPNNVKRI